MKNLPIDGNSREIQCSFIGYAKTLETGILPAEIKGYVRMKNVGDSEAIIRYVDQVNSDGVILSPGETEYFYILPNREVEIIQGTLNIMY